MERVAARTWVNWRVDRGMQLSHTCPPPLGLGRDPEDGCASPALLCQPCCLLLCIVSSETVWHEHLFKLAPNPDPDPFFLGLEFRG